MENTDKELNELRQENYRLRRCLGLTGVVARAPIATIEEAVSRIVQVRDGTLRAALDLPALDP